MGTILIRCTTRNELVPVGIETDIDTFKSLPNVPAKLRCPLCGEEHSWSKADALLETTGRAARRK
jgi:hypothetical protein